MEIIHLILGKANPERMNGVNRVVYQLASHQHKHGRKVSIWGITRDLSRNYNDRSFPTELFPASRNPFGVSRVLREAIASMEGRRDVVFHLHGGWVPVYGTLSRLLHRHGLRYALTGHGAYNTVAMQRSRWKKQIYYRLFEKGVLEKASQIHSIGRSEMDGLHRFFPNQKSTLLPYGFEMAAGAGRAEAAADVAESFQPSPAGMESGLQDDSTGFIIGFVGRLDTWTKGLDLLIQSFGEFRMRYADARLWILGDGPGRADLESYIAENDIEGVELWGSRFGEEKDRIMSKMHVFAHPSRNEGLPASVLEAAALGVPVVVSHETNVADQVRRFEAGVGLAENSSRELSHALGLIYEAGSRGRERMGANAREMVNLAFCWKTLVPRYDDMYGKTLGR
jgi:glycosyltransferase involved in cell wall biosynthesis